MMMPLQSSIRISVNLNAHLNSLNTRTDPYMWCRRKSRCFHLWWSSPAEHLVVSAVGQPVMSPVDQRVVSAADQPVVSPATEQIVPPLFIPVSPVNAVVVSAVDQPVVSPVDQRVVSAAEQSVVSPVNELVVSAAGQPVVSPVNQLVVSAVDQPVESPVEELIVSAADQPAVSPVEQVSVLERGPWSRAAAAEGTYSVGDMLIADIGGVHCLVETIDLGEDGTIDVQPWGRYSKGRRFYPSWLDRDDDEIFVSEGALHRRLDNGEDLSTNWTAGLTVNSVIARGFAMRSGHPPKELERLIGKPV